MKSAALVVLGLACVAGNAASAELLSNGGFESPISYSDYAVGNWLAFFGPAGAQNVSVVPDAPHSGLQNLNTSLDGAPNTYNGVVQPVDGIITGNTYTMSLWARAGGLVQNGAEFRIEWVNAGGGIIGDQFALNTPIAALLTNEYQQFSVSGAAPADAVRANVVIAIQTFANNGTDFSTHVYWDDVSFVPAPGAAVLLGLGGLVAGSRRRR